MGTSMGVTPDPRRDGQESVWAYPRPAIAQPISAHLKIEHGGITVAETTRGVRTLETSHPPSYYFPPEDVNAALLSASRRRSICEWKGGAVYHTVTVAGETFTDVAWSYPDPTPGFLSLKGFIAFYPKPFDRCLVDGEVVIPQPGDFYGGWITSHVAGPFKGVPGSRFW